MSWLLNDYYDSLDKPRMFETHSKIFDLKYWDGEMINT